MVIMWWIEWWNKSTVEKKQEYILPVWNLETEIRLCDLKNSVNYNEDIKNWNYIRKNKQWKSCKAIFLDWKWIWNKPDKYTDIYDMQWKKYYRAWEWEQKRKEPETRKEMPEDSELITYMKEKNIIADIKNSIVYYVPIEDGKWNIVKYEAMYISKDSTSEIHQLPIRDINWNILRYQTIVRNIPLGKPAVDPIDLMCLWWSIWVSFWKSLASLAPKAGINLSKTVVNQVSNGALFLQVLWKEIPKEIFQQFTQTWIDFVEDEINNKKYI